MTLPLVRLTRALLVQADENPASPRALSVALGLLPPPGATYLTCRPVLLTSEGCLASQDPGIMGWMGWLSSSLGAEEEINGKLEPAPKLWTRRLTAAPAQPGWALSGCPRSPRRLLCSRRMRSAATRAPGPLLPLSWLGST